MRLLLNLSQKLTNISLREYASFGNNYRNPVITGILRDVRWNLPTLHPKWEAEPGDPRRAGKCPSILGKSAENAIDNDMSFW